MNNEEAVSCKSNVPRNYPDAFLVREGGERDLYAAQQKSPGGAHAQYFVVRRADGAHLSQLQFQPDTIEVLGVQGLTNEVLLAVVQHRLESFQEGPFACKENHAALTLVSAALNELEQRTAARRARGVEGRHVV